MPGIPAGAFSAVFQGSLVIERPDEIEGEVADDGHVDGAVALAVAAQVVVEDGVEGPVQAVLDGLVAAHRVGDLFGAEAARGP
jgi:hypothetical protein